MGVVLAVDYGEKRIGLAISDALGITANPMDHIKRKGDSEDVKAIDRVIKEREVEVVVVGLPINMNGTEGPMAQKARKFAEAVAQTGVKVELWDERLSSWQAERALEDANLTMKKRKKRVDKVAAQFILQSYLDAEKE